MSGGQSALSKGGAGAPAAVVRDQPLIAYTLAGMYGAGALTVAIEYLLRGGQHFSLTPGIVALVVVVCLLTAGPRLPRWALAPLGPIAVAVIAYGMATNGRPIDASIIYTLPVLWTAFFFGRRGALAIVACIGVAHGLVVLSLPGAGGFPGAWVDVMLSVSIIAAVVRVLAARNHKLLARLAGEARSDKLTGLLNRRGFEERAQVEFARARRESHSIAVVSIDIDYFKRINDEWGHEIGDRVLARLGAGPTAHSRDIDVVARFGGEEFVVVLPGSGSADADTWMQRIRGALAISDPAGLPAVRVSAGIAAAVAPASVEELLGRADSALYAAKRGGRDRIVISSHGDSLDTLALESSV